jgi:hypothetical protein
MRKKSLLICLSLFFLLAASAQQKPQTIWSVGKADNSANEFALAPNGFNNFIGHDFGFEDKFFLVGYSKEKNDFPMYCPARLIPGEVPGARPAGALTR